MKRFTVLALMIAAALPAVAVAANCSDPFGCDTNEGQPLTHHQAKRKPPKKLTMAAAYKAARRLPHTGYNLSCSRLTARRVSCGYSYPETANYNGVGSERTGRVCHNTITVHLPVGSRTPVVSSAQGVICEAGTWLE